MIRKTGYMAALLALMVMGCAGHDELTVQNKQDGKTFWTHRYQFVRLVPQDRCQGEHTANNHPQNLGDRLRAALASLRIDMPDREKTVPVFTHSELELLTAPLLRAFEKANPDEDIALAIEAPHQGTIGYQRTITTARLFVRNDDLQIVFGQLHEPFDEYDTPFHAEPRDFRMDPLLPGSRCKKAGKKFPTIIATNTVRFHEQEGAPRKNWLVVSLSAQPQPVPTPTPMTAPPAYQAVPQATPQAPAYQAVPQTGPPAMQTPASTAPTATQDATTRMMPPAVQQPPRTILERLQILKDLRVKGLITEQEYQDKKQEILDSL